ncbi:EamA family transporter RarD [Parvularcula lutaonensis]|uniref:EamA family transporter RarD n=1 Tax=Parvularcula lutaonensis TaxID=491923 RepID=A0ABV7MEK4_9PROT|nr:EamA family transporter RarD [Parvularcula lutaonensis]GGY52085.1 permease [Parvularcula lutaonensis]
MSATVPQNETRLGVSAAIAAYTMWGLLPLFLIALRDVGADQVLVHRIIWSVPFGALIIIGRKQWPDVKQALRDPKVMIALFASSAIIALNWLIYIAAVQSQHIFEASLGYYINPLIYVLVGVLFLGEKLGRPQQVAVALAVIGVSILTVYGGKFPTISLVLAVSFTGYGYIRKLAPVGAMPGLFIETLILAPFALGYLLFFVPEAEQAFGTAPALTALLLAAGPITVLPLLCFALGARRLQLSTLGFLQFIGPTLQFLIGLIDGEPFTRAHQLCFAFIWIAAGIFAWDAIRRSRAPQPKPALQS